EGCASILWKSADKKEAAADAMGLTADRLSALGLVDEVLKEPLGAAHRDPETMAGDVKAAVLRNLAALEQLSPEALIEQRQQRLAGFGVFSEAKAAS
ncbi:MAG: acetyl-CoA carboxylase carboxyl transferase subunit alpha, partial [Nevskiaceae bacterium]|nr:acetyl-CoA carboxylase carboxyl transferase subunit alpha [Nevskiaceae bacterium]